MVPLSPQYNPQEVEAKWRDFWKKQGYFHSRIHSTKKPYTVVMPPPNVTGVLHMGHVLNVTVQDVLMRQARMADREACWVPGTDHAAIATEAKVMAMLRRKGICKKNLSREEFLQHAWAWKERYGHAIIGQLKLLGASCDWDRLTFTLDPAPARVVTEAFVRLYEDGHIYRGNRMIHWDPQSQTALADDEVKYRSVSGKLYYIRYSLVDETGGVIVATTRPETLLGDTALCVHPQDDRYLDLQGKRAYVPLVKRPVPIIADTCVDTAFGTGCLKVTPAHDEQDYALSQRHGLPVINILEKDGTLDPTAQLYIGEDRFAAREKLVRDLARAGHLVKVDDYVHNVGFSERTQVIVEPYLSTQWFVRMKKLAKPALASVLEGTIQFHPAKFRNPYRIWLEHVRDWCISRQLWWGNRIPAYYLPDGQIIVASSLQKALKKARKLLGDVVRADMLRQDQDVLDTWFSAWLWPMTVFGGIEQPGNEEMAYYYPTHDLVTAPEIIFFWVARMIMASYYFQGKPPFRRVYFTGIVRDKLGRKMSKSLGNSPDLAELVNAYGVDGVRMGMLCHAPAGNDILFDNKLCEQGRAFANKIWNALRLVKQWELRVNHTKHGLPEEMVAVRWFNMRLQQVLQEVNACFEKLRLSTGLMSLYKLFWDDFCASYLEVVKPNRDQGIHRAVQEATIGYFKQLMKLLHPFMPFITEEVWSRLHTKQPYESLTIASWPVVQDCDEALLQQAKCAFELVNKVRHLRVKHKMQHKRLSLGVRDGIPEWLQRYGVFIKKLACIHRIDVLNTPTQGIAFEVAQCAFVLLGASESHTISAEQDALRKRLNYCQGFLEKIMCKLANAQFLDNAPQDVVARERKKHQDISQEVAWLEKRLAGLGD